MKIKRGYCFALSLGLLLLPGLSFGQASKPSKGDIAKQRAQAGKLYEEATTYFKIREYEKALALYKEAYLLSQEPSLFFNMAQCHRLLGHLDEALSLYRSFVTEVPQSSLVATSEELIAQLEVEKANSKLPTTTPSAPVASMLTSINAVPVEPLSPPTPALTKQLYGASAGAGLLSLTMGAASLLAARKSAELQREGNFTAIQARVDRSRRLAALADISLVVAVSAAGAGYLEKERLRSP